MFQQVLEKLLPVTFLESISIVAIGQIPKGFPISIIVVMCVGIDDHGQPSSLNSMIIAPQGCVNYRKAVKNKKIDRIEHNIVKYI